MSDQARDDLAAAMELLRRCEVEVDIWLVDKWQQACCDLVRDHGPALLALLDAEPVAWIPVSERLPEIDQPILYYAPDINPKMPFQGARLEGNTFGGRFGFCTGDVTHWMPLPARPEARDE